MPAAFLKYCPFLVSSTQVHLALAALHPPLALEASHGWELFCTLQGSFSFAYNIFVSSRLLYGLSSIYVLAGATLKPSFSFCPFFYFPFPFCMFCFFSLFVSLLHPIYFCNAFQQHSATTSLGSFFPKNLARTLSGYTKYNLVCKARD